MRTKVIIVLIFLIPTSFIKAQTADLSKFVDPFIGTKGGGNTFPGTSVPYGKVKLGPDCGNKNSNSGYIPDGIIHGFSHTHVSGTGDGAKYGNILVMPFNGDFNLPEMKSEPKNVVANPGYFSVELKKNNIKAELTGSHSVGFHKYTFTENNKKGILIEPYRADTRGQ